MRQLSLSLLALFVFAFLLTLTNPAVITQDTSTARHNAGVPETSSKVIPEAEEAVKEIPNR